MKLGDKVKDKYTGLEGIATCISKWISGNTTVGITPTKLKEDGTTINDVWIEIERIEVIQDAPV